MIDWTKVKRARWLPCGDEGLVMVSTRVVGVMGRLIYVPWIQHECGAWYPLNYTPTCLFCGESVMPVIPS